MSYKYAESLYFKTIFYSIRIHSEKNSCCKTEKYCVGWVPRNYKILFLRSKFIIFREKITKMLTRESSRIFTNSPFIWFPRFPKNDHSNNGYFHEKLEKSYIRWIRRNPRILPSKLLVVIMFVIFPKKSNLRLKLNILKFLGIQPSDNFCVWETKILQCNLWWYFGREWWQKWLG